MKPGFPARRSAFHRPSLRSTVEALSHGVNRLSSISSKSYGTGATNAPASYPYSCNSANQRTRLGLADGSYRVYRYVGSGKTKTKVTYPR